MVNGVFLVDPDASMHYTLWRHVNGVGAVSAARGDLKREPKSKTWLSSRQPKPKQFQLQCHVPSCQITSRLVPVRGHGF